jgi:hypothetical protein
MTLVGNLPRNTIKAAFALLLLFLAACSSISSPYLQISGSTMGTSYHITLRQPGEEWTEVTDGTETWTDIAAGSEVWTTVTTGSEVWLQQ